MTILVGNLTPFTIWKVGGSLVGACRTVESAIETINSLRSEMGSDYVCKDPDGDVLYDSRATPSQS